MVIGYYKGYILDKVKDYLVSTSLSHSSCHKDETDGFIKHLYTEA